MKTSTNIAGLTLTSNQRAALGHFCKAAELNQPIDGWAFGSNVMGFLKREKLIEKRSGPPARYTATPHGLAALGKLDVLTPDLRATTTGRATRDEAAWTAIEVTTTPEGAARLREAAESGRLSELAGFRVRLDKD